MSDTPRTDTQAMDALDCNDVRAWESFARKLEREITALQSDLLGERIKREAAERRLAGSRAEVERLLSALAVM